MNEQEPYALPELLQKLIRFYFIHGHIDVPKETYEKVDKQLGRSIELMRKRKKGSRMRQPFDEALQCHLPGVHFMQGKQYCSKHPPDLFVIFHKPEYMYQLIMWLVQKMHELSITKKRKSTAGLSNFQGTDRGMFAQYLFRGMMGANNHILGFLDSGSKNIHDCWTGLNYYPDRLFFARIFDAVGRLVTKYVGFDCLLHTALFLGKCSLDKDEGFVKHVDDFDRKMAGFVGAVSFCLAESGTVTRSGGVTVFPECSTKNTKCSMKENNRCGHRSQDVHLNYLDSCFVPADMYHQSIYPEGGTQLNIIMFFVRSRENATTNQTGYIAKDPKVTKRRKSETPKRRSPRQKMNLSEIRFEKDDFMTQWTTVKTDGVRK